MQRAAREATEAAWQLQIVCVMRLDAAGYRHHPKPHVRESEPLVYIRGETRPHHPHHLHHVVYFLIHELKECSALLSTSLSAVETERQIALDHEEREKAANEQIATALLRIEQIATGMIEQIATGIAADRAARIPASNTAAPQRSLSPSTLPTQGRCFAYASARVCANSFCLHTGRAW